MILCAFTKKLLGLNRIVIIVLVAACDSLSSRQKCNLWLMFHSNLCCHVFSSLRLKITVRLKPKADFGNSHLPTLFVIQQPFSVSYIFLVALKRTFSGNLALCTLLSWVTSTIQDYVAAGSILICRCLVCRSSDRSHFAWWVFCVTTFCMTIPLWLQSSRLTIRIKFCQKWIKSRSSKNKNTKLIKKSNLKKHCKVAKIFTLFHYTNNCYGMGGAVAVSVVFLAKDKTKQNYKHILCTFS